MAVPDHFHIVTETFNSGQYDLTNHADHARFVDDVVIALHAEDPRWGHLKKKPGQTQIHGHGEDSALYKLPSNAAQAVDFIGGAGGPHPTLRWGVDGFPYTHADWLDPADHENGPAPPAHMPYPGDHVWDAVGDVLFADYAAAGQSPNPGMGRWFGRVVWDAVAGDESGTVLTVDASIAKHRGEWRDALGLPPL